MSFDDFIIEQIKILSQENYYKLDIKTLRKCWDVAFNEGFKVGQESFIINPIDETCESSGIF